MQPSLTNTPRLLGLMEEARLDGLLASAPHNVRYLTGYHNSLDLPMREWMSRPGASEHHVGAALAVLSTDRSPTLIVGPGFVGDGALADNVDLCIVGALVTEARPPGLQLPRSLGALDDARRYGAGQTVGAVVDTLRDRGLDRGRIGIDTSFLPPGFREELALAVPAVDLLECRNLLRLARMVKSAPEIALLGHAAAVNERAAVAASAALDEGNSTGSVIQRFRAGVAQAGALFDHCTPTIAGMSFVASDKHVLADQETFAFDVGCSVEGYYADAQFTVAVTPSGAQAVAERYDVLRRCVLDVGLALARAGTRASVIHHAMADFVSQEGLAAFPSGHGLGLEYRDYPIVVADSGLRIRDECVDREADLPLEVDMVLNVEATAFLAGVAAVGCEVTCVVTDADPLLLSPEDRTIRICRGAQR